MVGIQRGSVHPIRQDDAFVAHRRIRARQIERNLVTIARLYDDDIGEFFAADRLAGGSADLG